MRRRCSQISATVCFCQREHLLVPLPHSAVRTRPSTTTCFKPRRRNASGEFRKRRKSSSPSALVYSRRTYTLRPPSTRLCGWARFQKDRFQKDHHCSEETRERQMKTKNPVTDRRLRRVFAYIFISFPSIAPQVYTSPFRYLVRGPICCWRRWRVS